MPMMKPLPFLVLAVLLAGCGGVSGPASSTTTAPTTGSAPPPSSTLLPDAIDRWAVPSGASPYAFGLLPAETGLRVVRIDLAGQTAETTVLGSRPGSTSAAFAAESGNVSYLVVQSRPPDVVTPLAGWTSVVVWPHGGPPTLEEAHPRWLGQVAVGAAAGPDGLAVLTAAADRFALWQERGGAWSSEAVPSLTLPAQPALAANGTHLLVAGRSEEGAVVLVSKAAGSASFRTETVRAEARPLEGGQFYASARPGRPPLLAWTGAGFDGLDPASAPQVARKGVDRWTLAALEWPPIGLVDGADAGFVLVQSQAGPAAGRQAVLDAARLDPCFELDPLRSALLLPERPGAAAPWALWQERDLAAKWTALRTPCPQS